MDFAPRVKAAVDIVAVLGEYVRLKKQGVNRFVGLCPFHSEKTPSFSVHAGLQFFKCFGCGKGGDVFTFLMEMEGLSFFEALKTLAEQNGIPLPRRGPGVMADEDTRLRAAVYQMHEMAQRFFAAELEKPEGAAARAYVERRGLSPKEVAEFGLGFAPGGNRLARMLEKEGLPLEQIEKSGLALKSQDGSGYVDRFRRRLMFPLHNESGRLIAFAGRALEAEQQPKYMNSPETPIYRKSQVVYNLQRAKAAIRQQERAVLVEGYMDAIGVWRAGVREVVASCGTSLTTEQARMIGRHSSAVTVNFDPDAAGRAAAERTILIFLDEGLHVRVTSLPEGLDPDEFCRRRGAEAYQELLGQSPSYFFWLADRAREKHDARTAEGRVAAFQSVLPAVNRLRNKIERVALVNDLADRLGVEAGLVLDQFRRAAERREPVAAETVRVQVNPAERLLLRLLLESEEARRELLGPLQDSSLTAGLATVNVFRALAAMAETGEPFDFAALEARLGEPDRRLVSQLVLAEGGRAPDLEHGRAALRALQDAVLQAEQKALHRQIQEAQKAGNVEEALRLIERKRNLTGRSAPAGA